jgi:hypothetical protein
MARHFEEIGRPALAQVVTAEGDHPAIRHDIVEGVLVLHERIPGLRIEEAGVPGDAESPEAFREGLLLFGEPAPQHVAAGDGLIPLLGIQDPECSCLERLAGSGERLLDRLAGDTGLDPPGGEGVAQRVEGHVIEACLGRRTVASWVLSSSRVPLTGFVKTYGLGPFGPVSVSEQDGSD